MGEGEDHWREFDESYARKSREHRQRYAQEHPEPEGWTGFYAFKDSYADRSNSN